MRAVHGRVRGTTPSGVPYRADDPHLLAWIHAAEVDSFLASYQTFGAARLDPDQADGYVRQSGWVAEKLGVLDPPQTVAELDDCLSTVPAGAARSARPPRRPPTCCSGTRR